MRGRRTRFAASWVLAAAGLLAASAVALAVPGDLDGSFDGDGRVVTPFAAGANDLADAVLVLGNNKIVAVGRVWQGDQHDFALARYLVDGTLDPTWDGDGKLTTEFNLRPCLRFGACRNDQAFDAVRDSSGRIVAVGGSSGDIALARYNPSGALDPTFDTDGLVQTDFGSTNVAAGGVALQSDGKIVVVATVGDDLRVYRYRTNGSLDPAFDQDGQAIAWDGARAVDVAIQPPDQKVVVLGEMSTGPGGSDYAFARLLPNGALDTSFSGDGRTTIGVNARDIPGEVAVQQNGRIVAAGLSYNTGPMNPGDPSFVSLVRLNAGGSPDSSFDGNGIVTTDVSGADDGALALALQPAGKSQKIVAAGFEAASMIVLRYLPDGTPDPSWVQGDGSDGVVSILFPGSVAAARAVGLHGDGRIVVAGEVRTSGYTDFGLARLLNA